jgi:hypothetical protein
VGDLGRDWVIQSLGRLADADAKVFGGQGPLKNTGNRLYEMKYALLGVAVLGGIYCLHRMAVWAEQRGWIYYRTRSGSSGALGSALLEVQAIIEPSKRYVQEEKARDHSERDDTGDPPKAGVRAKRGAP